MEVFEKQLPVRVLLMRETETEYYANMFLHMMRYLKKEKFFQTLWIFFLLIKKKRWYDHGDTIPYSYYDGSKVPKEYLVKQGGGVWAFFFQLFPRAGTLTILQCPCCDPDKVPGFFSPNIICSGFFRVFMCSCIHVSCVHVLVCLRVLYVCMFCVFCMFMYVLCFFVCFVRIIFFFTSCSCKKKEGKEEISGRGIIKIHLWMALCVFVCVFLCTKKQSIALDPRDPREIFFDFRDLGEIMA